MHRTAAIISQGDEIVLGQTLDTNSRWLSERLTGLGVAVVEHVSIPDDRASIASTFRRLASRVDLILCSGGLGPTDDDLTRFALSDAIDEPLIEDVPSVAQIEAYFAGRGRPMPAINRVQALRPSSGACLENRHGTAPGIRARLIHADVFCLPGPPRELVPMFEAAVIPALALDHSRTILTRALHTIGLGESDIATLLSTTPDGNLMSRDRSPLVGTTASGGIVSVRIRAEGASTRAAGIEQLNSTERHVRNALGSSVFAADGPPHEALPAAVLTAMKHRGLTLAVCESCTGGMLGSQVADVPGCSDVYMGGLITYANDAKAALAGVPLELIRTHGAVSAPVASAMARGASQRLGTSAALAITGIAGPSGGTSDKPVGTVWISLALRRHPEGPVAIDTRRFLLNGDRRHIREFSTRLALGMLWFHLAGTPTRALLRQVESLADQST